jgi:hypothetical protein
VGEQVERDGLAGFCADLGSLRALLRGPAGATARARVEQVVQAARRGEPVAELIASLHPVGAPADDDELRTALPPRLSAHALPPATGGYACPTGSCNRVESRRPGSSAPRCDVHQQALRFRTDVEPTR